MEKILKQSSRVIGVGSDKLKKHNKKIIDLNYSSLIEDKESNILEIGFGWNAVFLEYLYEKGYKKLSGIDMDTLAYKKARLNLNKNIKLFNTDIVSFLNKDKNKYDIIIMRHLIEHISKKDIENILSIIYDNLNKNGKLIIETPNVINTLGLDTYNRDYTHQTPFCPETLLQSHHVFSNKKIVKVQYPIINYTSVRHFIGSLISKIIAKIFQFIAFIKSFAFGNKGPYTMNIIGVFKK